MMSKMNRREFLKATAIGTSGLISGLMSGCAVMEGFKMGGRGRPNVLFIICDDLNDSIAGMGGHPQAKTPNINRLMRKGVRFVNAQCNDPLCAPSRASMLSGLYPHTTGYLEFYHWRKNAVLGDCVSLMEHFRNEGYGVYCTGKLFHNQHEDYENYTEYGYEANFGPFPWDGVDRTPADWQEGKAVTDNWKEHPQMQFIFKGHESIRTHWEQTFGALSNVPDWPADPEKGIPGYKGWRLYNRPFRYVSADDRDLVPDELYAQYATEVLQREHDKPLFLGVGFCRPHTPLYAPKEYFDMFPLESIQLPPYKADDLEDCAEALKKFQPYGFERYQLMIDAGGEEMWKRWIQAYLACVAFVDDQVGKVLAALEKSPYAKNTIVIVTSDHGFHMGEKDYLFKDSAWEESCRIPLVVYAPGVSQPGTECEHPVSLIDLYPTLIDLCGLDKNPNAGTNGYPLDGYSIRPFLHDPYRGRWRGPAVALSMIGGWGRALNFSVRSRDWRYVLCENGEEELYDHRKDPHEWTNLAQDTRFTDVKNSLRNHLIQSAEPNNAKSTR